MPISEMNRFRYVPHAVSARLGPTAQPTGIIRMLLYPDGSARPQLLWENEYGSAFWLNVEAVEAFQYRIDGGD